MGKLRGKVFRYLENYITNVMLFLSLVEESCLEMQILFTKYSRYFSKYAIEGESLLCDGEFVKFITKEVS